MKLVLFSLTLLLATNCASGPVGGLIYSNIKYPGTTNGTDVKSTTQAEDCIYNVLGLVGVGNSGAGQIAKNNKIGRIATIDYHSLNVLIGVFRMQCTVVTGEKE
ncbi:TRL domain-containing protein [Leptospira sp. 'Mane']|uniref:TRL domain-containing protein n=1 Tax=Leptospira sp. 'Mane' TaxID=3387407 RepID=UPI00398AEECE